MSIHELAGKQAPQSSLINIPKLISAYYVQKPNPAEVQQQVSFGTSGHRGSSLKRTFNEWHILAICQAICEIRQANKVTGPLFIGKDTHGLSEPAFVSAVEVFAANAIEIMLDKDQRYTPTPVISHAILCYNQEHKKNKADGVVITPSHNPPQDGGLKYNPPNGGPADTSLTNAIQDRANAILRNEMKDVKRIPFEKALCCGS
jgi:phosphoglucomutase